MGLISQGELSIKEDVALAMPSPLIVCSRHAWKYGMGLSETFPLSLHYSATLWQRGVMGAGAIFKDFSWNNITPLQMSVPLMKLQHKLTAVNIIEIVSRSQRLRKHITLVGTMVAWVKRPSWRSWGQMVLCYLIFRQVLKNLWPMNLGSWPKAPMIFKVF